MTRAEIASRSGVAEAVLRLWEEEEVWPGDGAYRSVVAALHPEIESIELRDRAEEFGLTSAKEDGASPEGGVDEGALRAADARGDPVATARLGQLLEDRDDLESAEAAYRRADAGGSLEGTYCLGLLHMGRGEYREAEVLLRRAEASGHAEAAFALAGVLLERGDLAGMRAAVVRAFELAHPLAELGVETMLDAWLDNSDGGPGGRP
jgi:hypothetical protein